MERIEEILNRKALPLQQMFDLSGKVAIVTGGAQGLGLAIVDRLSEAGAQVIIADKNASTGQKAVEDMKAKGRKVDFIQTDVRLPVDSKRAVKTTVEKYGNLDILVNNAGVFPFIPTLDMTEDEWNFVVDTDLKGTFFFCQAAANAMIAKKIAGRIINIASVAGLNTELPIMMLAHYYAAKGGVVRLTQALAKEFLQYGINVNCVCPGSMLNMDAGAGVESRGMTEEKAQLLATQGGYNLSTVDEVARVVFIFATSIVDQVRGVSVAVDGGTLLMHIEKFLPPLPANT